MSPVSAVLDRLRSAARRPSAPPRDPGAAASLATLLAAADADHWHAGDTRVVLPAQRRSVDLRVLELEAGGLQLGPLRQAQLVTADAGPPPLAPPAPLARAAQAWQARPGPTTWFG